MTKACVIDYNGCRYIFNNTNDEVPEMFIKRCWFLVKNRNKYDNDDTLDMMSHIYVNEKYLGARYDKSTLVLGKELVDLAG